MAIGPLGSTGPLAGARPVEPVAEANAVRVVAGRLAALAKSALGAEKPLAPMTLEAALARAVAGAVQSAAPRQGGLGPLMADLAQALASPDLPPAVREAGVRLLGLRTPLTPTLSAQDLRQAVARSGLFLEARLAAQAATGAPLPPDLKAALLNVREALAGWAARAAPPGASAPPSAAAAPPPPFRGGPVAAQPPASTPLPADPQVVARRLVREAEGAVARQELLQAASLPSARPADAAEPPGRSHWLFEIPFATPQGTAVAQFEVERDGGGADGGAPSDAPPHWRARFALDVEPFGPVHAQVTLSGARAGVQLWAERPETALALRAHQDLLRGALELAAYAPEVAVMTGAPPKPAAPAGLFVDRSS